MNPKVRGIRGATTILANTQEAIYDGTRRLITEIFKANHFQPDDVASVFLTMTPDLTADFPAKAVRSMEGWQWVPLMCATELGIDGAMERCIRVLLHVNTQLSQEQMRHVYLEEAVKLRPDVVQNAPTPIQSETVDETKSGTYDEEHKWI